MEVLESLFTKALQLESPWFIKKIEFHESNGVINTESQRKSLNAIESMPKINLKTLGACHIRENFQEIYREATQEGFERALKKWYFWATHSRIEEIKEVAKIVKRHWSGVLRWYVSRINNGTLRGQTVRNLKAIIYMFTGKLDYTKVGPPT